jgi:hypothetical protein
MEITSDHLFNVGIVKKEIALENQPFFPFEPNPASYHLDNNESLFSNMMGGQESLFGELPELDNTSGITSSSPLSQAQQNYSSPEQYSNMFPIAK